LYGTVAPRHGRQRGATRTGPGGGSGNRSLNRSRAAPGRVGRGGSPGRGCPDCSCVIVAKGKGVSGPTGGAPAGCVSARQTHPSVLTGHLHLLWSPWHSTGETKVTAGRSLRGRERRRDRARTDAASSKAAAVTRTATRFPRKRAIGNGILIGGSSRSCPWPRLGKPRKQGCYYSRCLHSPLRRTEQRSPDSFTGRASFGAAPGFSCLTVSLRGQISR
jgi:hypothetical protein